MEFPFHEDVMIWKRFPHELISSVQNGRHFAGDVSKSIS